MIFLSYCVIYWAGKGQFVKIFHISTRVSRSMRWGQVRDNTTTLIADATVVR